MKESSTVLNIPIAINGGDTVPEHLDERELFIDKDNSLYVGKGDKLRPVKVNADKADTLVISKDFGNGATVPLVRIEREGQVVIIGGMSIDVDKDGNYVLRKTGTGEVLYKEINLSDAFVSNSKVDSSEISNCDLTGVNKLVGKLNQLYGKEPGRVKNPVEGQIFFKVVE